ncbi:hypothetical protein N305_12315, partial [Manacus vitellinus]
HPTKNQTIIMHHHVNDILITTATKNELPFVITALTKTVQDAGFQIVSERIQPSQPWIYLGWRITQQEISPQPLQFKVKDTLTLHELQKLLGAINWLRSILGLTTEELHPLFMLLREDSSLTSNRSLTAETKQTLDICAKAIENRQGRRRNPELQICLAL